MRISLRRSLALLAITTGSLFAASVPALAAAPEVPTTGAPTAVHATTALLHGVLQPAAASSEVLLEHEFFLAPRGLLCNEDFGTPEVPGLSGGLKGEAVTDGVRNLEPSTEYAVCLAVRNTTEEAWTFGAPKAFTTLAAPPALLSQTAPSVKGTEVRFEALLNPENQVTECNVEYGEAAVTENTIACEQPTYEGFGEQAAGVTVTGLKEGATYHWRVVLKNAKAETTTGTEESLTTTLKPEEPTGLEANPVGTTTATLNGTLNPNAAGNPGTYEFLYRQSATECEGEFVLAEAMTGAQGQAVTTEATGLLPHAPYSLCLRVTNGAGETASTSTLAPVHFTTGSVTPSIIGELPEAGPSSVQSSKETKTGATLEARLNPNGTELTSCKFEIGTDTNYGTVIPCAQALPAIGSGRASVPVSANAPIEPNVTYHWRFTAGNGAGSVSSVDHTFVVLIAVPAEEKPAEEPPVPGTVLPATSPFPGSTQPAVIPHQTIPQLEANEPKTGTVPPPPAKKCAKGKKLSHGKCVKVKKKKSKKKKK